MNGRMEGTTRTGHRSESNGHNLFQVTYVVLVKRHAQGLLDHIRHHLRGLIQGLFLLAVRLRENGGVRGGEG